MSWSWALSDPSVLRVALGGLALVLLAMSLLWLVSLRLRDASVVDAFWGAGFTLLALFYAVTSDGVMARKVLLSSLTLVWGARLSVHILKRRRGQPEDPRYAAWHAAAGRGFWWSSYFSVFLLQGVLMWVISAPLLVGQASVTPARLTVLDALGAGVWAVGFLFEAVGDAQLRRFKADPANRGAVLQTGLWAYTRHPNYFGDSLVWWSYFLISLSVPGGVWTIFSPLLMTLLLLRVSGVSLLESELKKSKPGYTEYVDRTSAFFPWPPSRWRRDS
jgi:steroid 5-alpha reductase family enzyme